MGKRRTIEEWKEELVEKQFGRLTVRNIEPLLDKNGNKKGFQAVCTCSCGNTKSIPTNSLLKGLTTSCGCYRKEITDRLGKQLVDWHNNHREESHSIAKSNYTSLLKWKESHQEEVREVHIKNGNTLRNRMLEESRSKLENLKSTMIGKKYGKLIVEDIFHYVIPSTQNHNGFKAVCRCACGRLVNISVKRLLSNTVTSCGCSTPRKSKLYRCSKKDISTYKTKYRGNRYSRLVIQDLYFREGKHKQEVVARCLCDCGNTTDVLLRSLRTGNTKSCGCYSKEQAKENVKMAHQWFKDNPDRAREIWKGNKERFLQYQKDYPEVHKNHLISSLYKSKLNLFTKEERSLYTYLVFLGYSVERQFLLEDHYYDFRINNFLIEYHGSVYHCSNYENTNNPTSKPPRVTYKEPIYHKHLRDLAISKGYYLIQIWDYQWIHHRDFVENLLREQLSGTADYRDYLNEQGLLNNDYGFIIDGKQIEPKDIWVATGYRTIVDSCYPKSKVLVYNSGYTKIG